MLHMWDIHLSLIEISYKQHVITPALKLHRLRLSTEKSIGPQYVEQYLEI